MTHVGPIVWQRGNAELPEWLVALGTGKPLVWVYSGNPRWMPGVSTAIDSIVVIHATIAALAVLPGACGADDRLPGSARGDRNAAGEFLSRSVLPGSAMAERCQLMVHHGGHSSVMQSLAAGTPSVMIPTITERESNARRLVALGAGEMVMPVETADGEKQIDIDEFTAKIQRVLNEPSYRASARRVAESMRNFGGAEFAADLIEKMTTVTKEAS